MNKFMTASLNALRLACSFCLVMFLTFSSINTLHAQCGAPCAAQCPDVTVTLNANGSYTLVPDDIFTPPQNCMYNGRNVSPSEFDCTDAGSTVTVVLSVTDFCEDASSCTANVTVEDQPLNAVCKDVTVNLDVNDQALVAASDVDNGTVDNCAGPTLSVSPSSFDCNHVGDNTVTLTASAGNANSTCTANVNVVDATAPSAKCKNSISIAIDADGVARLAPSDLDNGSSDNCGIVSMSVSPNTFGCGSVDNEPSFPQLTVSDGSLTSNCATLVTVTASLPTAICQDVTVQLDAGGQVTVDASAVNNGSSDPCTNPGFELDPNEFDCSHVGSPQTVTLFVFNDSEDESTCTAMVTVEDNILPTAKCRDVTIQLNNDGYADVSANDINNGSSDNCGVSFLTILGGDRVGGNSRFYCGDLGNNTVTLAVDGIQNQSSTCTANVAVEDNIPPDALCEDITINLDQNGMASFAVKDIDGNSSDNCEIATFSASMTTFDCSSQGSNSVVLTVDDPSGNLDNCTATVTVVSPGPTVLCKDITISLDGSGNASISASDIDDGSNDPCGFFLDIESTEFDCDDIGSNTVDLFLIDTRENIHTCTATVTVEDNNAPTALCKDVTVTLDQNGNGALAASEVNNGSSDECGMGGVSLSKDNFTCLDPEVSTVTLTASDVNGNQATCTANVTVEGNSALVLNCPTGMQVRNTDPGSCDYTVILDELDPAVNTGNCQVPVINDFTGSATLAGAVFGRGRTTVTWIASDGSGNTTSCSYDIRIRDREAPEFENCPDDTTIVVPFCTPGHVLIWPTITATDNCTNRNRIAINELILNGSFFSLGTTTVSATATDRSGNQELCEFDVTVEEDCDPLPPGMTAVDIGNTGGVAGVTCYDAPTRTYEIKTSGSGIINNTDGFHFVSLSSQNVATEIVARIVGHPTNTYGDQVGVMIRQNGTNNTAHVSTLISGDNKTLQVARGTTGMFSNGIAGPTIPGPLYPGPTYWVRLTKMATYFTSAVSPDGINWTTIGTVHSAIMGSFQIGIAATAGTPGNIVHYTVDNVKIDGVPYKLASERMGMLSVEAFPNPVKSQLTVRGYSFEPAPVLLTLRNAIGQAIFVHRFEVGEAGQIERQLEMEGLASGVYLLELKSGSQSQVIKVVKD